ncbi:uncharacterized protein LOC120779305 isoform X2 [Bactrocera tryoni]|uniref:uncharacterized protein LOC120779305 isoform X2 n=1 Tax=Bactrocera tryoni TaxID=59916 RepID=UPI001A96B4A9|nr:uncharacterized protein LOC120779305 isoform X2 [Bactrocera tryoni]
MAIAATDSTETESEECRVSESEKFPTCSSTPQRKRSKKSLENRTEELVGLASEYFKKPETEADIIAKGWALKLNRLAADQKRFAEKIINDTLFEAENESLTKLECIFLLPIIHLFKQIVRHIIHMLCCNQRRYLQTAHHRVQHMAMKHK